jgi:hypothetical protein
MHKRRTQLLNLLVVASVVVLYPVAGMDRAAAQVEGCRASEASNWWVGNGVDTSAGSNGRTFEGAAATFQVRDPYICVGTDVHTYPNMGWASNDFSTAWTMLGSPDGQAGYIQVGYWKGYGYPNYYYTEDNIDGSVGQIHRQVHSEYGALPNGAQHQYWVQYDPAVGLAYMNVDLVRMDVSYFNPLTAWGNGVLTPQWMGEVTQQLTNVPGLNGSRVNFHSVQVQRITNDWIAQVPYTYHLQAPPQGLAKFQAYPNVTPANGGVFDIWDN